MQLAIEHDNSAIDALIPISSANSDLKTSMLEMQISMDRLSATLPIQPISDEILDVAVTSKLTATILYTGVEGRSDKAEDAQTGIENILQRMQEVSVKAASDKDNSQDRTSLPTEMEAMFIEAALIAEFVTRLNTKG